MPQLSATLELNDDELQQLHGEAEKHGLAPAALVELWVRGRLVHEYEKAQGLPKQPKWDHSQRDAAEAGGGSV